MQGLLVSISIILAIVLAPAILFLVGAYFAVYYIFGGLLRGIFEENSEDGCDMKNPSEETWQGTGNPHI